MAESVLNRKPQAGMATAGGIVDASKIKTETTVDEKASIFFLSRKPVVAVVYLMPNGQPQRIRFENYRYATSDKHIAECIEADLVKRGMAAKVSKEDWQNFGRVEAKEE